MLQLVASQWGVCLKFLGQNKAHLAILPVVSFSYCQRFAVIFTTWIEDIEDYSPDLKNGPHLISLKVSNSCHTLLRSAVQRAEQYHIFMFLL